MKLETLNYKSQHKKTSKSHGTFPPRQLAYRLFALDVSVALLACPERQAEASLGPEQAGLLSHRFLVQSLVFGRRSDSSPTVRAHALTCLSRCLEMPSLNATRCIHELFSSSKDSSPVIYTSLLTDCCVFTA